MNESIAGRMRNNLKKDYGIKVFHMGKPLLAIRIPKYEIGDFNKEDTDNIKKLLAKYSDQIRPGEVVHAYIIAEKSHIVLDPYDLFGESENNTVSKIETLGDIQTIEYASRHLMSPKKVDHHTPKLITPTYTAPISFTPVFKAPVHLAPTHKKPEIATEEKTPEKKLAEKSDEKVVRKILSDFARGKTKKLALGQPKSGRRAEVLTKGKRGRYVKSRIPDGEVTDIAIAPTIRAAAIHAQGGRITVKKSDYREKVRRRRIATLINIVMDTSGSMDEIDKIDITRSVIVALLKDAYQRRDRVSLVTYSGRKGEMVLPFTSSVERAKRYLETIPFGGTTPLASGMLMGIHALHNEIKKDPSTIPIMVLVTDGKVNVPLEVGGNIDEVYNQ
jgi:Mg-chelatase subunit ChlD